MVCLTTLLLLVGVAAVGDWQATAQTTQPNQTTQPIVARIPVWQIQEHFSHDWLRDTITHGLVDYWVKYSVAPNGFIQEDLDRQWKHWGTQEEATVNGQGRQLLSMTLVYEMNGEKNKEYLDAMTRAAGFLLENARPPIRRLLPPRRLGRPRYQDTKNRLSELRSLLAGGRGECDWQQEILWMPPWNCSA